uniref:Uncharacterized protein n=1 Tax=Physcomitrium patens TaxID=3218 RepID=A0A2K1KHD0_PHYPA|nr:hypothetical protein PHYPA_009565 [Physcomitrium patens]
MVNVTDESDYEQVFLKMNILNCVTRKVNENVPIFFEAHRRLFGMSRRSTKAFLLPIHVLISLADNSGPFGWGELLASTSSTTWRSTTRPGSLPIRSDLAVTTFLLTVPSL